MFHSILQGALTALKLAQIPVGEWVFNTAFVSLVASAIAGALAVRATNYFV